MKIRTLATIILLSLLPLGGCRKTAQRGQQSAVSAPPPSAPQFAHQEGGASPAVETRYFRGSIGSALGLQMKLGRDANKLTGTYFYQKIGTKIDLRGSIEDDGRVILEEFDPNGKQTGTFTGQWTTDAGDGMVSIAGNWTNAEGQKQTAFSLHEEPIFFSSGVEVIPRTVKEKNKKLKYEIDVEYPQLMGLLGPGFEKFNQEAMKLALREVNEFKKNMTEGAKEEQTSEESSVPDSTLDMGYTIAMATDDLISVQLDVGSYYHGAAHPNSNSQVLNFDVDNGRTLRLADVFKPGAKYLQVLSSYAISDLKKQSSAQGADGMLDDESIKSGAGPSAKNFESWTVTKKGLGITFDAYQVGPYAAGPQYVLVPYSVMKEIIDPNGVLGPFIKPQL